VADNVGWASPTSQVFDLAVYRDACHASFVLEGWVSLRRSPRVSWFVALTSARIEQKVAESTKVSMRWSPRA